MFEAVSCGPGWPPTCYTAKVSPELLTFSPLPSKCWNYSCDCHTRFYDFLGQKSHLFSEPHTAPNRMTEKPRKRKYKKDFRSCVVVCIVTLHKKLRWEY